MDTLTLTWRALTVADAGPLARLMAAAEAVDATGEHYDEADMAEELADPGVDLARDSLAAVAPDGEVVAYVGVRGSADVRDVDRLHLDGVVRPDVRGRGLGRRLLDWAAGRAAEVHAERHPEVPGAVDLWVPDTIPTKEALARAAGFQPVRYWFTMRRDLAPAPPPAPAVPAGLTLVPYDPERDEQLRLAHCEAFAGHWGSTPPDPQRWRHWYTGAQAFEPGLSWLVLDGDDIAGYLTSYHYVAETAATGVREAYIGQIGVRERWRRQGLGALLIATALRGHREAGYDRASLNVDTGNTTGALGLYERAGFAVSHRAVTWTRPVG